MNTVNEQPDIDTSANEVRIRVAVLSVPFGGGHRSVAEGIKHALESAPQRSEVQIVDALDIASERLPLSRWGARAYFVLTRPRLRPFYATLFRAADSRPKIFATLCGALFSRQMRTWLARERPHIIVSTFPFLGHLIANALAELKDVDSRVVTFVTDAGEVNKSWFLGDVNAILVTDETTEQSARRARPDRLVEKVELPLRADFYERIDRDSARRKLGLGTMPTVLVWGGGQGLATGIESIVSELIDGSDTFAIIAVVGDNAALARRLRNKTAGPNVRVLERCDDIPFMLAAVDAVVGKAGWVSLCEARAFGLSTGCFDALPGQEQANLAASDHAGFALPLRNDYQISEFIRTIEIRTGSQQKIETMRRDRAEVAEEILKVLSPSPHLSSKGPEFLVTS